MLLNLPSPQGFFLFLIIAWEIWSNFTAFIVTWRWKKSFKLTGDRFLLLLSVRQPVLPACKGWLKLHETLSQFLPMWLWDWVFPDISYSKRNGRRTHGKPFTLRLLMKVWRNFDRKWVTGLPQFCFRSSGHKNTLQLTEHHLSLILWCNIFFSVQLN